MKYTIDLRNDDRDVVESDEHIEVEVHDGCIIIWAKSETLAIYPIKEVIKINKVVE